MVFLGGRDFFRGWGGVIFSGGRDFFGGGMIFSGGWASVFPLCLLKA